MAPARSFDGAQPVPLQHQLTNDGTDAHSQGELDGLCGLYAGINGLRLLLGLERRLRSRDIKRLFKTGIGFLHDHGHLQSAMAGGFCDDVWRKLLTTLVAEATAITGRTISMTQPLAGHAHASRRLTFDIIDAAIARGQPVLIELSGTYHHFTVVNGYSPSTLFLFDSGALVLLRRKSCTTAKHPSSERHRINPHSLTILALAPGSEK